MTDQREREHTVERLVGLLWHVHTLAQTQLFGRNRDFTRHLAGYAQPTSCLKWEPAEYDQRWTAIDEVVQEARFFLLRMGAVLQAEAPPQDATRAEIARLRERFIEAMRQRRAVEREAGMHVIVVQALDLAESLLAAQPPGGHTIPCVNCGKPACTIEDCATSGHGDSCELAVLHGWVCSEECWDRIAALFDGDALGAGGSTEPVKGEPKAFERWFDSHFRTGVGATIRDTFRGGFIAGQQAAPEPSAPAPCPVCQGRVLLPCCLSCQAVREAAERLASVLSTRDTGQGSYVGVEHQFKAVVALDDLREALQQPCAGRAGVPDGWLAGNNDALDFAARAITEVLGGSTATFQHQGLNAALQRLREYVELPDAGVPRKEE